MIALTDPAPNESLDSSEDATNYHADLPTWQLIIEIRRVLAAERNAERLVCRYLADMADRVRQGRDITLFAYGDELEAMRGYFGLGVRGARERIRIGRALRTLPRLEQAFIEGRLSYSRVREVTRVATLQTELDRLDRPESDGAAWGTDAATSPGDRLTAGDEPPDPTSHAGKEDATASAHESMADPGLPLQPPSTPSSYPTGLRPMPTELHVAPSGEEPKHRQPTHGHLADGAADAHLEQPQPTTSEPETQIVEHATALATSCHAEAVAPGRSALAPEAPMLEYATAVATSCHAEAVAPDRGALAPEAPMLAHATALATSCHAEAVAPDRSAHAPEAPMLAHATALGAVHNAETGGKVRRCPECNASATVRVTFELSAEAWAVVHLAIEGTRRRAAQPMTDSQALEALARAALSLQAADRAASPSSPKGSVSSPAAPAQVATRSVAAGCSTSPRNGTAQTPAPHTRAAERGNDGATQRATPRVARDPLCDRLRNEFGIPVEPAAKLLRIMGRRPGWTVDELIEVSGISIQDIKSALTLLELGRHVRRRDFLIDPIW